MPYEQKKYNDPRRELQEFSDEAKKLLSDWKTGKPGIEGYIPFAADIDAALLTEADMTLWRRVKDNASVSREEFGLYGARLDEELARIDDPRAREQAAKSRHGFKGVISHLLMEQWGQDIGQEADAGAGEERAQITGRNATIEANADKMAHTPPPYRP